MKTDIKVPSFWARITSVWNRHYRVYTKNIISNAFPPFLEPLIFMAGIGLGLGVFVKEIDGVPYIQFLATGLLISTSMMTSAFECSYGTFIRMEFDKVYDGMIAAPMTAVDLLLGEILWSGSKGFFFSFIVLIVVTATGIIRAPEAFLIPFIGFLTGLMFSSFSLFITSFVKNIDHFSFYFTGFLSPMFFFSGIVFPVSSLPAILKPVAEVLPLTHPIRISRAISFHRVDWLTLIDFSYIIVFIIIFTTLGVVRLRKRIID